ncbi:MAG TPA: DUF2007 domain-containing protein [Kiritimatiellia bacterium]|nr:DUF2007 domain-containing protein [Kiritimatiellia bacterium]HNS81704.1 DUF2007 domain-containing protein [Kiritimatiellia bacterium]HPA78424.1 DUF2007 domain-containing protein [Kiritimatiellia bacterium]HQQ04629.1 DUF2007 domain-containing protein [Kiritimatiellia bacterium]
MNPPLAVLRTYISEDAASMDRLFLEASDIETLIEADDCGGMTPYFQQALGVRLLVREEDLDRAKELLASAETSAD